MARPRLTEADRRVQRVLERPPIRQWPRARLREEVGVADRTMRESIERLRLNGVPVLASSRRGGGYWIAQAADEIARFRAEQLSRARVILDVRDALRFKEEALRAQEQERVTEPLPVALL